MNPSPSFGNRWLFAGLLILLGAAAVLIYANAVNAPFVFDDGENILENPRIRLTGLPLANFAKAVAHSRRPVADLTFAWNYYWHGYDVTGYHVVNIAIHILTGFLMFLTVRHTLALMRHEQKDLIAWLAALLWIVNPLHTQSVTYIVQRMTALSAMFYLLALYLYIKGRLRQTDHRPLAPLLFFLCGLCGIFALFSKQIAATLPVFLLLYEWYFFQDLDTGWIRKQIPWIGAAVLGLGIIAALYLGASPVKKVLSMYGTQTFTMGQRLLTEPRVILLYLSLLLFPDPARLNPDYDFPVSTSLMAPVDTILSMAAITGLLILALLTAKKYRLASFGILWFFGNLFIESSFLGLALIFEHRTYLPSIFVFAAIVWALVEYTRPRPLAVGIVCVAAVLCGFWTCQRNAIWADDVTLWRDAVRKSPDTARPWSNLGLALQRQKDLDQAAAVYNAAIRIDPGYVNAYNNLGALFLEKDQPDKALPLLEKAVQVDPSFMKAYNNLAITLHRLGQSDRAADCCRNALKIDPADFNLKNTLGVILLARRKTDAAAGLFAQVLAVDPTHLEALINMALIKKKKGDENAARALLEKAIHLHPDAAEAEYYLGLMIGQAGDTRQAMGLLSEALRLKPDHAEAHNAIGDLYRQQGKTEQALDHYRRAVAIDPGLADAQVSLADLLVKTGRAGSALNYLETVAAARPRDAELLARIGLRYQQNGDIPAAMTRLGKAVDLDPACAACLSWLGLIQIQTGNLKAAEDAFERLARLVPDNPIVYYNLACIYARQDQTQAAVNNLQKAMDAGYDNLDHIRADRDLDSLRTTPFYKTRIEKQP